MYFLQVNLTVDWDNSPVNYTCFDPRNHRIPVQSSLTSTETCESIPRGYRAQHVCMFHKLIYNKTLPTFGPHRPLWPVYGEYQFLPVQRWLHSLEVWSFALWMSKVLQNCHIMHLSCWILVYPYMSLGFLPFLKLQFPIFNTELFLLRKIIKWNQIIEKKYIMHYINIYHWFLPDLLLQHGGIVMLYHPCAEPVLVHRLRKLLTGCFRKHIITPYTLLTQERVRLL